MDQQSILVRKATLEDAVYIALLARITFTEAFSHLFHNKQHLLDYYHKAFSVEKIRNSIQKDNNVYFIAFCDELPVGYAKLKKYSPSPFQHEEKISQLEKIYVLNNFISLKIGKQLMEQLLEQVQNLKSTDLWLAVYVDNHRAISFYEKNGFSTAGNHTFSVANQSFDFIILNKAFDYQ